MPPKKTKMPGAAL
jgi:hypothetical protein